MDALISALFGGAIASIRQLLDNVRTWVTTWWTFFVSLVARWLSAFQACVNASIQLGFALFNFAEQLSLTLLWFLVNVVPAAMNQAFNQAIFWAEARVRQAENLASRLVADLRHYADEVIAGVRNFLLQAINAVIADVRTLWNRFLDVERRVASLLTHPETLADWIAGVIVQAVVRWAVSNGAFLFTLFRRNAVKLGLGVASILETIITQTLM